MAPARKKQKLSNGRTTAVEDTEEIMDQQAVASTTNHDQHKSAEQQRQSLFVRSLPATTTSESLTELFSESYPIKHATAVIDPGTKQCRGYGFVTFADAEDAQRAKGKFNGHEFEGRKLRVEIAEPRHRDGDGPTGETKIKPAREVQPTKLIVRNLPWSIKGPNQLAKLFQSYGTVKQAYVPSKEPGLMAGFGFVVMRGRKNAEKALEGVNGKQLDGRTLAVDWAVEKKVYAGAQRDTQPDASDEADEQVDHEVQDDDNSWDNIASEEQRDDGWEKGAIEAILPNDGASGQDEDKDDQEADDADDDAVEIEVDGKSARSEADQVEGKLTTLFIRNLPFTCTDEDLEDHFTQFGSIRYARVVLDPNTERSKGTGFVCFYRTDDTVACLRGAPKRSSGYAAESMKDKTHAQIGHSILQNEDTDPSGQYTLDGRVLQVSRAVEKSEATRLTNEGATHRMKQREDRRRLYLLSEGTISSKSKLWDKLSPSERTMREASAKQRKMLVESNPSLHLSLTRLSIRNIPRTVGSKELKALAREAVVGFATDVKSGVRQSLSKEEVARGGEEMANAEQARKRAGKGVVKQAKVVFEGAGGSKVSEDSGAGRSRGYGFIEYHTHRSALMGLRWLNGHAIRYQVKSNSKHRPSQEEVQDRKKRLIVEFAIENAQVVMRRKDRETKARERSALFNGGARKAEDGEEGTMAKLDGRREKPAPRQGKTFPNAKTHSQIVAKAHAKESKKPIDGKLARRNQIIGRKRAMRKTRRAGK